MPVPIGRIVARALKIQSWQGVARAVGVARPGRQIGIHHLVDNHPGDGSAEVGGLGFFQGQPAAIALEIVLKRPQDDQVDAG